MIPRILLTLAILASPYAFSRPVAVVCDNTPPDCEIELQRSRQAVVTEALELLKRVEGYLERPEWDVNALRNGYGTPAKYAGEPISRSEAHGRALTCYLRHSDRIRRDHPHLNERQIAALAVMRYNVGSFGPGLSQAIATGEDKLISSQMRRYVKSAGKRLDGLVTRRELEINLMSKSS